jgi:hypothetical protein
MQSIPGEKLTVSARSNPNMILCFLQKCIVCDWFCPKMIERFKGRRFQVS